MALATICVVSHLISDAQSVTVYLKDGTSVTYNEARFDHLQFNSKKGDEGEVFNILTPAYIPDAVVLQTIRATVAQGAEELTNEEAAAYTGSIRFNSSEITDLQGLEYLTGITELGIQGTQVTDFRLPSLPNLRELNMEGNNMIEMLDLSLLPSLQTLAITTALNTGAIFSSSMLPESLTSLSLKALDVTELDLRRVPNITYLNCSENLITSLDLSSVPNLKYLNCYDNRLSTLNASGCQQLETLTASQNKYLYDVNIKGCTALSEISLFNTSVDYLNLQDAREVLRQLSLGKSEMFDIDLHGCVNLENLELYGTHIDGDLDLSDSPLLKYVNVNNSSFSSLLMPNSELLEELQAYDMGKITRIQLAENLPNLFQINLWGDKQLSEFSWGNPTCDMLQANICVTSLTRMDISQINPDFEGFIDLLENPELTEIKVWPDFDFDNPPMNIEKDSHSKFVLDFSE